jgi:phosphoribosylanthranilate isomerase
MYIKVCGMRDPLQVEALDNHVDFLGFIYYPGSPRVVLQAPTSHNARRVGVFVNASTREILDAVTRDHLDFVQLHGAESVDFTKRIKRHIRVIKAFGVHGTFDFQQCEAYSAHVDYFLFDTFTHAHGGSGRNFHWTILEKYQESTPFFLSGGLSPQLFPQLVNFQHPRCVGLDLNSGFELHPGNKDVAALTHFITHYHAQHFELQTR